MAQQEIVLPELGESVTEAKILRLFKRVGDSVATGEVVAEVATDKVDSHIDATCSGVVTRLGVQEGDIAQVGQLLLEVQTEAAAPAPSQTLPPPPSEGPDGFLSPLVSNMIHTHQLTRDEIAQIRPTGKGGRIRKQDIELYLQSRSEKIPTPLHGTPNRHTPPVAVSTTHNDQADQLSPPVSAHQPTNELTNTQYYLNSFAGIERNTYQTLINPNEHKESVKVVDMSRMRSLIASHMLKSIQTSAHTTLFAEADVTDMVAWRNANKHTFEARYGEKITYTHLVTQVVAACLAEFPLLNSSIDGDKIVLKQNIHIGIATALPSGDLIVPVVKNANRLSLEELTRTINDLVNKARENKLKYTDIEGGTFTISNIGSFNAIQGTPIIQQPQVGILAVGTIKKRPAAREYNGQDAIVIRELMYFSLSVDHRIIDGMIASNFLNALITRLENFQRSMIV